MVQQQRCGLAAVHAGAAAHSHDAVNTLGLCQCAALIDQNVCGIGSDLVKDHILHTGVPQALLGLRCDSGYLNAAVIYTQNLLAAKILDLLAKFTDGSVTEYHGYQLIVLKRHGYYLRLYFEILLRMIPADFMIAHVACGENQ